MASQKVQQLWLLLLLVLFCSSISSVLCDNICEKDDRAQCLDLKENVWKGQHERVVVLTVATNITDGYKQYIRSANVYDIPVTTLGLDTKWKGGSMKSTGGGQKINLLKQELKKIKEIKTENDAIIIFTDSYDVIFLDSLETIVTKFKLFEDTRVLFSAEQYCWPDESLKSKYPNVEGNPYLNSGSFMGYLNDVYDIVSHEPIDDEGDDQLYYTNIYLNEELRIKHKIKLDHKSNIFQNLYGAYDEVKLINNENVSYPYITNTLYDTRPVILHGNGLSKTVFNSLASYLAKSWSILHGCKFCKENYKLLNKEKLPVVLLSIFVEYPTPFLEEFFLKILALNYPKNKIHLFLRNNVQFHWKDVKSFIENEDVKQYASFKQITSEDYIEESHARKLAMDQCKAKKCDFLFAVDSIAHLDDPNTLIDLIETNVGIVAPLLVRPGKSWSNFWGALTNEGFYARSIDYMEIAHSERKGIWNVPFINACYLLNSTIIRNYGTEIQFKDKNIDPDMKFCASLRDLGIFMYVSNLKEYGHLIDPETFDITLTNPDVYQIFENSIDWEQRYIHPDYSENFNLEVKPKQPCPDVYWFPMTSMRFCKEYIEMMEAFGKWSDGTNSDERLQGGYEAVPTRDIHTNQVGFERHWLHILKQYVRPLQELVFTGYYHDPPRSLMNFVVRYKPGEQPFLRPHHDSSTYTINLALNTPDLDYKGGGCHFIRYNCSVQNTRPGWLLMHPGRLTHFHEGLLVTEGIRYIMVSFVDP